MNELGLDPYETFALFTYAEEPLIMYAMLNPFSNMPITRLIARQYKKPCTLICNAMNSIEHLSERNTGFYQDMLDAIKEFLSAHHSNRFVFLGATTQEVAIMKSEGFEAVHVNHNAFLNQEAVTVKVSEKPFAAIYNAQFSDFKRHSLASQIDRLALVYGLWGNREERFEATRRSLPSATFLNGGFGPGYAGSNDYRRLSKAEVNELLCQSSVGLCLSAVEGAMYASFEYLLAGIPVVSTASYGGREVLFPPDFAKIVEPDPEIIARSVRHFELARLAPDEIRASAIAMVVPHRERFQQLLSGVCSRMGISESEMIAKFGMQLSTLQEGIKTYPTYSLIRCLSDGFS